MKKTRKKNIQKKIIKNNTVKSFVKKSILVVLIIIFTLFFIKYIINLIVKNVKLSGNKSTVGQLNSIYFDPMNLINLIQKKDKNYVLADLRSKQEFKKSHIKTSVNLSPEVLGKKVKEFEKKTVILYGQSAYSSTPRNAAYELLKKNINVKILSIGWNEFRHFRNLWVPEDLWDKIHIEDYID